MKLSVVINTLDEEGNLPTALKSIGDLADEIVVVDMDSTDNTVGIAEKFGAKVYKHKRTGYVEPARNYAISKATGNWILILDADEILPKSLRSKIQKIMKAPDADYYRLPRKNIVFGKWMKHSRWWPDYNIRLFRRGYVEWSEEIHSVPVTTGRGTDLAADQEFAIIHHNYNSVDQYIKRMSRYTTIQAKQLKKQKHEFKWQDLIRKPVGEFASRYFQGLGYKDGIHGLVMSGLQAFSEFVVYVKLWELNNFEKKNLGISDVINVGKTVSGDLNYWKADALIRERGGLLNKIKRKFKLP